MRLPGNSRFLQELYQNGSVLRLEEVATPGKQATDAHCMLGNFVAPHRAIALFDPPADGPLRGIVGAIEGFLAFRPFHLR